MPKSLLPHEGLTLEAMLAPVRLTLLQPLFTGTILFGLYRHSTLAPRWLPENFSQLIQRKVAVTSLGFFFGLGLLRKASNSLSHLMLNNFKHDTTWNWAKEIVVVTGGSSGIGALAVQRFAEKGVKVIVLDITVPENSSQSKTTSKNASLNGSQLVLI